MRVGTVSVSLLLAVASLTAIGHADTTHREASRSLPTQPPAGYEVNSTQAVCALTGNHGKYVEKPHNYTAAQFGLISGDSGSSFEYDGEVWWLFGNTGASSNQPWTKTNQTSRWPDVEGTTSPAELDSDSIATSSMATKAPLPVAPYDDSKMPPDQQCPQLQFVKQNAATASPFVNPSVYPDPLFPKANYYVSLRRGELPEAGIAVGNSMYVVFGTDNPGNCLQVAMTTSPGPCTSPPHKKFTDTCGNTLTGARTRSVMAVYEGDGRFEGLYDLSAPTNRYQPWCPTKSPADDDARFVNVQMAQGNNNEVYIWGTEGGANTNLSPVYLARVADDEIATGQGMTYWDGQSFVPGPHADPQSAAKPLFVDEPSWCASQMGVQYNQYLKEWMLLYRCNESPAPSTNPNGIYLRTALEPWGPWSAPTTIFDPTPNTVTKSGFCYFIYTSGACPPGSYDSGLADNQGQDGGYYGPYFVANWTTGTTGSPSSRASTTIYYTLDTFDPYGQLIMRSTILGAPLITKPTVPPCSGSTCT